MNAPDITNLGLLDLMQRNPMFTAAGLLPRKGDIDLGARAGPGKSGPGKVTGARTAPIMRRTSPVYAGPPEKPSFAEQATAIGIPLVSVLIQRALQPRASVRRRMLAPALIAAGLQSLASELALPRQHRQAKAQDEQEDVQDHGFSRCRLYVDVAIRSPRSLAQDDAAVLAPVFVHGDQLPGNFRRKMTQHRLICRVDVQGRRDQ